MGFSKEWEEAYRRGTNLSIWPWSDLVSLFYRFFPKSDHDYSKLRVLELGCGAGANIPFFVSIGAKYYSIEGSETETAVLLNKYDVPDVHIVQGDFSKGIPFDAEFDLVFDRAAVAHNDTDDIRQIISMSYDRLRVGGCYIGIDWFSTKEKEFEDRKDMLKQIDDRTFRFSGEGTYANLGNVHFTDRDEILDLFSAFSPRHLALKSVETMIPDPDASYHWDFVMKKE